MRVLIVDDEAAARRRLGIMLSELDVEVVGEAVNGLEALDMARAHRPDVMLLDISMPEIDGFDVAQHLEEPKPIIVFQTAYDEFALKAFDHQAVDYLVKPVTLDKLGRAIERAQLRLTSARNGLGSDTLRQLRAAMHASSEARLRRLLVREGNGHRLIRLSDVLVFRSVRGTIHALTADRDYVTDYTLADLEERAGGDFVRPNRSELVNQDVIERVAGNGDGSASLTLCDGTVVHVTRRRAAEVRRTLEG